MQLHFKEKKSANLDGIPTLHNDSKTAINLKALRVKVWKQYEDFKTDLDIFKAIRKPQNNT